MSPRDHLSWVLAVLVSLTVGTAPAAACSIAIPDDPPTDAEVVASYDLAIYGRVASVRETDRQSIYEARIRVSRVYRGRTGSVIRVRYTTQTSACGTTLKAGRRIGLLLDRPGRPFSIGSGNRISRRRLDRATGGRYHRPSRP